MKRFDLRKNDRKLAILVDPDKHDQEELLEVVDHIDRMAPDYIFLGGSLIYRSRISDAAQLIRSISKTPLILFPGHFTQLTDHVDAVLLLSLISGRNPDLLIGQHVLAAPRLKKMSAEIVSTGYMLIDGGRTTSVSYISHTQPIPRDKNGIALCTAQAGELIGMQTIYMDAGSGADVSIPEEMIRTVSDGVDIPLIVGGGIQDLQHAETLWNAGANLIVIGTAFESMKTAEERSVFARRSL